MTKESRRWAGEESNNPFNGDDAAQHHMLADGRWIWMLRFRDGTTSVGLNGPSHLFPDAQTPDRAWQHWSQTLQKYPTLDALTTNATLVNPTQDGVPQLAWMPRVGRLRHYMYAAAQPGNWAMLPSAVGIVDPLHSTGIAHSLSGVQRLARILLSPAESQPIKLHAYARDAYAEVRWIDRLIGLCYRAERLSFSGFVAACSFYFLAAIHCERQMALGNTMPMGFLMHRSPDFCARLQQARSLLETLTQQQGHGCTGNEQRSAIEFVNYVRTALRPWNDVGLMDPSSRNRIARSSADK